MSRFGKMGWLLAGHLLLVLAPGSGAVARQDPGPTIDQAFQAAGVALTAASIPGCTPIASFDFPSIIAFSTQMRAAKRILGATDATVNGIRVVFGANGGAGLAGGGAGGNGAPVTLVLGNNNLVIAWAGDGGPGGNGAINVARQSITGGRGGDGGDCTITCNDENSIFAAAGYGGTGGNGGLFQPIPTRHGVKGRAGDGGDGGNTTVTFNQCNVINALGGDGGVPGSGLPLGGKDGNGGDGGNATLAPTGTPNMGTVEAGAAGGRKGRDGKTGPNPPPPNFNAFLPSLEY